MKIIGLTGNIASGKSSVSKILKEFGAEIIDMDSIAKEIQDKNYGSVLERIRNQFGDTVVINNRLNRKKLAKIVFSSKDALKALNDIMVPLMTEKLVKEIEEQKKLQTKIIVIDAAILLEAEWDKYVDKLWVVYTPYEIQMKRLTEREKIAFDEANMRIEAQMSINEKIMKADVVIDNSKDFKHLYNQVKTLWEKTLKCT